MVALLASCALRSPNDDALESLVAAERAFARQAKAEGIRSSFLANFAPDGITFEPRPARLQDAWRALPPPADPLALELEWEPAAAGVAASGLMGYTTGPFTLRDRAGRRRAQHGIYLTVWTREAGAPWRVAIDAGVRTPEALPVAALAASPAMGAGASDDPARLRVLERDAQSTEEYLALFADDTRLQREGAMPAFGAAAIRAALAQGPAVRFTTADVAVATSGDLAFSYGEFAADGKPGQGSRGHYVHLWVRDASAHWRVAIAIRLD